MLHGDEVRRRYPKFADRVRYGVEDISMIDDYIDEWHEGDSQEEIHEFLGLTIDQFLDWVAHNDEALKESLKPTLTPEEEAEGQRLYEKLQKDLENGLDKRWFS